VDDLLGDKHGEVIDDLVLNVAWHVLLDVVLDALDVVVVPLILDVDVTKSYLVGLLKPVEVAHVHFVLTQRL
jgi:hypothetical protein